jgi:hypothetical protein
MDVALAGARTVERILFTFGIHELALYRSTLGEYSSSEVKNARSSAPISLYVFSAWYFNKYRNILSFTLRAKFQFNLLYV